MQHSFLFVGLVCAVAGLGGCSTVDQRAVTPSLAHCAGLVNAKVSDITLSPSRIDIDPEPVCVNFNAGRAIVRWTFDQAGYVFPADAVTFASGAPSYLGAVVQGGRGYQVEIDPSALASWKYTIKLQSGGSSPLTWTCDPTIVNRESLMLTRQTFNCTTTLTLP